jgi:hypothetical protein
MFDILRFSFIKLGYIPYIPLKWLVIFLQSWISTGYFSNSTGSSVTNCRFSPIIGQVSKPCQKEHTLARVFSLDYPGWQTKTRHDTRRVAGTLNPKPKVDLKLTIDRPHGYGGGELWKLLAMAIRTILHTGWATCARPASPVLAAKFIPHVHNLSQKIPRLHLTTSMVDQGIWGFWKPYWCRGANSGEEIR